MHVGDIDCAPVDQERHRVVGNEAVIGKEEGERFEIVAGDRHGSLQRCSAQVKPPAAAHVPLDTPGSSKTRQVVVACASRRPAASVIRASAVAARRPTLSVRPSARIVPVSALMPRMKLILNSSVVYPVPAGSIEWMASPIAESSRIAA